MDKAFWFLALGMVARLTVLIRRRSVNDFDVVDNMAIMQAAIVGLSLMAVVFSGFLKEYWVRIFKTPVGILLVFYGFGVLSAVWSKSFIYSSYRAVETISQILVILAAISCYKQFIQAERRVLTVIALSMGLGMLAIIRWRGLTLNLTYWHTNQFTVPALILFCYGFGEIVSGLRVKDLKRLYLVTAVGFFGLVLGTSSASFISMIVGMIVALLLGQNRTRAIMVLSVVILFVLVVVGAGSSTKIIFSGKSAEQVEKMSGRRFLWENYWAEFLDNPIVGNGFAVGARMSSHFKTTNTHNSALSVLLGTGIVGMVIVLYAFTVFIMMVSPYLSKGYPGTVGAIAAIIAGSVNSLSVAYLGETWMMSSFSFFCMLGLFCLSIGTGQQVTEIFRRLIIKPVPRFIPTTTAPLPYRR